MAGLAQLNSEALEALRRRHNLSFSLTAGRRVEATQGLASLAGFR
ncbi:MAG: hypothetical protein AAFR26_03150 [Cyanobacteria bacterium J06626_4]